MPILINLVGRVFGELVVIKRVNNYVSPSGKTTNPQWLCQCSCGNAYVVLGSNLRRGRTKSCGCNSAKYVSIARSKDISGIRFGQLTAIKLHHRDQYSYWECRCTCGKTTIVQINSLTSGSTKSCGCRRGNYIHGKSNTIEYQRVKAMKRWENKANIDSKWTRQMDEAIHEFFTECVLCGDTDRLEVDHVYPLSKGYGLTPDNAVILCKSCNSSKRDKWLTNIPEQDARTILYSSCLFSKYWKEKYVPQIRQTCG